MACRTLTLVLLFFSLSPSTCWIRTEQAAGHEPVGFHFAVKNTNLDKLQQTFWAVSDPKSPRYGQYLSLSELTALVGPEEHHVDAVISFVRSQGARTVHVTLSRDFVYAEWTAAAAAHILNTEFCWFEESRHRIMRACDRKHVIPREIAHAVDFISGIATFPKLRNLNLQRSGDIGNPLFGNDPKVLRKMYSIPDGTVAKNSKNSQAVTGFLDQWFSKTDLQKFFETYSPDLKGHTCTVHGTEYPLLPGIEANLDVQYIMSLGDGVNTSFWSDDKKNTINNQEPWAAFLTMVANSADIPLIFSMSYGDDESSLTVAYMDRVNTELQKIGTRGTSMLAASGDDGSGCANGKFAPNFPATSPYLTAVGGTTGGSHERAAGLSSGGFSDVFARTLAPWQSKAVEGYLKNTGLPPQTRYNDTGRGYPDVAAVAENVPICDHGICGLGVAGTSCASPTFSGVVGLLNDARLTAGKKPLGFLNPLFYQLAEATDYPFNDITEGAGGASGCGRLGWPAKKGWDAVTGLGSPNYPKLLKAVMALP